MKQILRVLLEPAGVVKLVDTPDLGSGASRCEGSSPFTRTTKASQFERLFLFCVIAVLKQCNCKVSLLGFSGVVLHFLK